MKLRALLYSDLHFADPHLEAVSLALLKLQAYIVEHKPDLLINLGDTFHTKDYVSSKTLSAVSLAMRDIRDLCADLKIGHLVLSGNHDIADRKGEEFSSEILALDRSVVLVPSGKVVTCGSMSDPLKLGFINYRPNVEDVKADAAALVRAGCDAVCVHLPLLGAMFNPTRSDEGGVSAKDLGIKWIFAGHYHHPQVMKSGSSTTVIVGSPSYYTWGDEVMFDEHGVVPRGFLLVDFAREGKTPLSVKYRRLPNTYAEVRHTARVNTKVDADSEAALIDTLKDSLAPSQKLRVRAVGDGTEELVDRDCGEHVSFTTSSSLRKVELPDAPEVTVQLGEVDHEALISRVISESDIHPAMQKRVLAAALKTLEEARATG